MEWLENNVIKVDPPKRPKKITGTRFAAIQNLNRWSSPFEAWCAITRTYEKPFEDSIYTIAGKTIEPKQAEYMKNKYFWKNFVSPTDRYGADYFKKTWGDFFADRDILGGMWDYLFVDDDNDTTTVMEMKTTKRAEDWQNDTIPEYYAMQAALYAYLLHVDDVIMVVTVLDEPDYDNPEEFIVTPENTFERAFKVSERYDNFAEDYVKPALDFWVNHVVTGISPEFDEKRDAEILKELRKNHLNPSTDLQELVKEAEELKGKIDKVTATVSDDEKRLKTVKDLIKKDSMGKFQDGDKEVVISGKKYDWTTSKTVKTEVVFDEEQMKKDGVYDKYTTIETKEQYRFIPKERK